MYISQSVDSYPPREVYRDGGRDGYRGGVSDGEDDREEYPRDEVRGYSWLWVTVSCNRGSVCEGTVEGLGDLSDRKLGSGYGSLIAVVAAAS